MLGGLSHVVLGNRADFMVAVETTHASHVTGSQAIGTRWCGTIPTGRNGVIRVQEGKLGLRPAPPCQDMAQYPGLRPPLTCDCLGYCWGIQPCVAQGAPCQAWAAWCDRTTAGAVLELPAWPESEDRGEWVHFGHIPGWGICSTGVNLVEHLIQWPPAVPPYGIGLCWLLHPLPQLNQTGGHKRNWCHQSSTLWHPGLGQQMAGLVCGREDSGHPHITFMCGLQAAQWPAKVYQKHPCHPELHQHPGSEGWLQTQLWPPSEDWPTKPLSGWHSCVKRHLLNANSLMKLYKVQVRPVMDG